MNNIIFCPVGNPIQFHSAYDKDNHWRFTKESRNYKTVVYQYKDFDIEENSYDILVRDTGSKWDLAKHFLDTYDYREYDYIGFWDDDLITDIQSVNRAIDIASENDMKMFQLSTIQGSDSSHHVLRQNLSYKYSMTNFNEGMAPFFHSSLIPILLEFWNHHQVKSGWGFDMILSAITKQRCGVIHEVSMYHPGKESSYDKVAAVLEMYEILTKVYPKFMKSKYNEDCGPFNEGEKEYEFTLKGI
jgi:hypothetical protein